MQNKERFLDANIPDEMAATIRPRTLSDFIGHDSLKQNLSVFVSGARSRGEAMDHVLLYGPPGLGKTTLAHIVANELGTNFRATSAPMLTKQGDLAAILTALEPMDVLFIDEIHRLPTAIEEVLYSAMEDFKLDIMLGEGPSAKSVRWLVRQRVQDCCQIRCVTDLVLICVCLSIRQKIWQKLFSAVRIFWERQLMRMVR